MDFGDVDAIRKRPGMYIGDTADGTGLHNMVFELTANAVAEAACGFCERVDVALNEDGSVTVRDDGRGIPVETDPRSGRPALELILTQVQVGALYGHPALPETLHGVGAAVVNALSEHLCARVWRNGLEHMVRFQRGVPDTAMTTGPCPTSPDGTPRRGTEIVFLPDRAIFADNVVDVGKLLGRLQEFSSVASGATIILVDRRNGANTVVTLGG